MSFQSQSAVHVICIIIAGDFEYLRATRTRGITLKPCEVTTRVNIKKIGPWWVANVESNIIKPVNVEG